METNMTCVHCIYRWRRYYVTTLKIICL